MKNIFSDGNIKTLVIIFWAIIMSVLIYMFSSSNSTSPFGYGFVIYGICVFLGWLSSTFLVILRKTEVKDFSKSLWHDVLKIETAIILTFFAVWLSVKMGIRIQGSMGYLVAYIAVVIGLELAYFLILDIVRNVSKEYKMRFSPFTPM